MYVSVIILRVARGGRHRDFRREFQLRFRILPEQKISRNLLGVDHLFVGTAIHPEKPLAITSHVACREGDEIYCTLELNSGDLTGKDFDSLIHNEWEELPTPTQPSV